VANAPEISGPNVWKSRRAELPDAALSEKRERWESQITNQIYRFAVPPRLGVGVLERQAIAGMDGLDRLIEMLEKRFGKFWADALLVTAVVGAAAWGIHALFAYLIRPAIGLGADVLTALHGGHINRTDAVITAVEMALYITLAIVFNIYIQIVRKRANERVRKDAEELASIVAESKVFVHEQSVQINTKFEAKRLEILAFLDKAIERINQMDADSTRRDREYLESLRRATDEAIDAINNRFANAREFVERARKAGIEPPPELVFQEDSRENIPGPWK
jgi:hypothetical protein